MKSNRLIALLCAAAMLLSFTACDSKKDNENKSSNEAISSSAEATEKEETESKTDMPKEEETKAPSANLDDDLNDIVTKDVEDTVAALNAEYESLKAEIDTYSKYLSNTDKMEAFYAKVYDTNYSLCVRMYEYSLDYAESIVNSDMSNDDKYDELEELYDSIYDDAGNEIYDGIYDGIFKDMYDDFYDGLLDDAYDNEEYSEYSEWYDAHSNEYEWWYDTRSDVYEDWYDMRSDIYEFQFDLRSEIWSDDIDKALKEIDKFRKDIEKLKKKMGQTENTDTAEGNDTTVTETEASEEDNLVNGMRPEFKEALDSYEDFFDEYCDFMKKFNESPDDLSLLTEYTEYMTQYSETMEKMGALDDGEMNDTETKYYLEVTTKINQKLIDAAL